MQIIIITIYESLNMYELFWNMSWSWMFLAGFMMFAHLLKVFEALHRILSYGDSAVLLCFLLSSECVKDSWPL